jgi:hypothetical protein
MSIRHRTSPYFSTQKNIHRMRFQHNKHHGIDKPVVVAYLPAMRFARITACTVASLLAIGWFPPLVINSLSISRTAVTGALPTLPPYVKAPLPFASGVRRSEVRFSLFISYFALCVRKISSKGASTRKLQVINQ